MKKKELNLEKVHVDHHTKASGNYLDKSWGGEKLAYTKAGWATVTHDGTIVEVLDAFSGEKAKQYFIDNNELFPSSQIDESDLINPIDIASKGVDDDSEIFQPAPPVTPATATLTIGANSTSFNLENIAITSGGAGYSTAPLISISPPNAITGTSVSGYVLQAADVDGSGVLQTAFLANISGTFGSGTNATGTGYPAGSAGSAVTNLSISGTGSGAALNLTVNNGSIIGLTFGVSGGEGTGYAAGDTVSFDFSAPAKTQAAATAQLTAGVVTSVSLDVSGNGYTAIPTITVAAP